MNKKFFIRADAQKQFSAVLIKTAFHAFKNMFLQHSRP